MCGVTTHSRYRVIKETRYCLDGTRIGNMIEHLDTPPTDPRILVGQSIYDGVEGGRRQLRFSEASGRHIASETAEGLDLMTPLTELLHQELFRCHRGEDSQDAVHRQSEVLGTQNTGQDEGGMGRLRRTGLAPRQVGE
jgi:hypothetical protein